MGNTAFFDPLIAILPRRGVPPSISKASIPYIPLYRINQSPITSNHLYEALLLYSEKRGRDFRESLSEGVPS